MTTILTGSARVSNAALMAKIEALEARLAEQDAPDAPAVKRGKAAMPAFVGKAARKAGKGHKCAAPDKCGRADLRTAASTVSHDASTGHWHVARK